MTRCVIFLLGLSLLVSFDGYGQPEPDQFCTDSSYRVLRRIRGDQINVTCDTVYLLNRATFNLLYSSYHEYQNQTQLLAIFSDSAEELINLYKDHVEEQKEQFEMLQQHYTDLSTTSNQLINETSQKLLLLNKDIDSIGFHIDSAQFKIDVAVEQVKKAENKKWLWGLGGLGVGFLFATVILALQ